MDGGMRDVDRVTDVVMDGPFRIELLRSVSLRGNRRRGWKPPQNLKQKRPRFVQKWHEKRKRKRSPVRIFTLAFEGMGWPVL